MDKARYQVILTGELVSGFSREQVMASVAREFQTSAANLLGVFEGEGLTIDDLLDVDEASRLQKRLEGMGAAARVERVSSAGGESVDSGAAAGRAGLHLPSYEDPAEAGLMHCPACGHAQLVAKRCDECGVVFAEYNRDHAVDPFGAPAAPSQAAGPRPSRTEARTASADATSDIHADRGWREDWLDEADELPTEEYHVHLFMGTHSRRLADTCAKMMLGRRTRFRPTWAGGAVISPFLWAMHRKMWAWGSLIFIVEILLPVAMITLGLKHDMSDKLTLAAGGLMLANRIFWPAVLKSLYCRHARQTIASMHRMSPTYAPDIDIATRGGTSKTSVFVGIVLAIVFSLLAWSIVDTVHAKFLASGPVFTTPVDLPKSPVSQPKPAADPVTSAEDELLVNENRWVATRNKLRMLGQQISVWIAERGASLDPAGLDIGQIAVALSLESGAIRDGWDREIAFDSDGKGFRLSSAGPDGEFGSSDDVEYRRILGP